MDKDIFRQQANLLCRLVRNVRFPRKEYNEGSEMEQPSTDSRKEFYEIYSNNRIQNPRFGAE